MTIGKRIITGAMALFMCLALLPAGVLASEEPAPAAEPVEAAAEAPTDTAPQEAQTTGSDAPTAEETAAPIVIELSVPEEPTPELNGFADNDTLYTAYIAQAFGVSEGPALDGVPVNTGSQLTGAEAAIYSVLRGMVEDVAAGRRASTEFHIPASDVLPAEGWTAEDLGVTELVRDGVPSEEACSAVEQRISFSVWDVVTRLMVDLPCEMYWFDKTDEDAVDITYPGIFVDDGRIGAEGEYVICLCVAPAFRAAGDPLTANAAWGQTVQDAADNARTIVADNAGRSDYDKLYAYLTRVCELNSYNYDAAEDESMDYGNPWQLLWVFDEDPTTNVVCEGYAKAFQYLCDLTEFSDPRICCYSVWGDYSYGTEDEPGGHMWNVVRMDDGFNYLVDVTNCDYDEEGVNDGLFLKGCTFGSLWMGYYIDSGYEEYDIYVYDWDIWEAYTGEQLVLASSDYGKPGFVMPKNGVPLDEEHFPDANLRAHLREWFDWEEDDFLSAAELADVNLLNVENKGISSLQGIEYFPDLMYLYCAQNELTALDLRHNARLIDLECQENALTELDLSRNRDLLWADCSSNRLTSLTVGRLEALDALYCEDNALATLDISGCSQLLDYVKSDRKVTKDGATVYQHTEPGYGTVRDLSFDAAVTLITEGPALVPGDVNEDGAVDALDAARILQALVNGEVLDPALADANHDEAVTAADAAAILARMK